MDYLMVLRLIAISVIVLFGVFAVADRYAFSYTSPTRRYRYVRRLPGDTEFETRGSSALLRPALKFVANLPRYEFDKEPDRRIIDSKTGRVCWDNKED